jgi:RNA polymerase sigma-70 factor (ECF subfamily)
MNERRELMVFLNAERRALLERCLRLTRGERAAAEDLLAELELKLVEICDRGGDALHEPRAWCFTVLRNLWRDQQRRARRTPIAINDLDESSPLLPRVEARELVEHREVLRRCEHRLRLLPERQATALWLRVMDGRDYTEVAAQLATSRCNARKLVELARKALGVE